MAAAVRRTEIWETTLGRVSSMMAHGHLSADHWPPELRLMEDPSFDPIMRQRFSAIYHIELSVKPGVWDGKLTMICGAKFEVFRMKNMKVDLFVVDIQCGLIHWKVLHCRVSV